MSDSVTPWTAACQAPRSFTVSWSSLRLTSIEPMTPSKSLIVHCCLLLTPSVFPKSGSSGDLALCIMWPNYWSFSFSISPSSEYSGLIFFRIDWFDLLVIQGTFKSLLQHHSLKASVLRNAVKVKLLITQPCLTFCDPRNCSLLGSSVHGILWSGILDWVADPFSRGSS